MTASPHEREPSLATPLERLPGVGTARAGKLAKLGLVTVRDAVLHFPREYRDFSGAHAVADLREGEHASIAGEVADVGSRSLASGRQMLVVRIAAADGAVRAVWFNMPFMARRFAKGMRVAVAGQPRRKAGGWEFAHPEVRWPRACSRPTCSSSPCGCTAAGSRSGGSPRRCPWMPGSTRGSGPASPSSSPPPSAACAARSRPTSAARSR